jgi:hypothetical protein
MLLRYLGAYVILFMNGCIIAVTMVLLSGYLGPCGIIFANVCCYNHYHGKTVKGSLALWDNIIACLVTTPLTTEI